jgi:branched-chain amino acid transport system permease protein
MTDVNASPPYVVSTHTKASQITATAAVAVFAILVFLPFFAGRGLIQDMFFILTMLVLAQFWNLLAGYGGLVSIGQQAFVGMGAYAMFGGVILAGMDPIPSILLGGVAALLVAFPTAFFAFRLQGPYFAIGTWVIAEVMRLVMAQVQSLGGGTGTSSAPFGNPRDVGDGMGRRDLRHTQLCRAGHPYLLAGTCARGRHNRGHLRAAAVQARASPFRPCATTPKRRKSVGVDAGRMKWFVFLASAFGTGLAGALIYVQKARISPDAAFSVTDWTAYVLFIVIIGGIGTIEGPIIGVFIFFLLQTLLADYGSWYLFTLGIIGIVVMLFAPRGIWGLITDKTGIQLFPVRRRLSGGRLEEE